MRRPSSAPRPRVSWLSARTPHKQLGVHGDGAHHAAARNRPVDAKEQRRHTHKGVQLRSRSRDRTGEGHAFHQFKVPLKVVHDQLVRIRLLTDDVFKGMAQLLQVLWTGDRFEEQPWEARTRENSS